MLDVGSLIIQARAGGSNGRVAELALFFAIAVCILYGNVVYQLTRLGYLKRRASHHRATDAELALFVPLRTPPTVTYLVPSYKEDPQIILRSLLSACLQMYPEKRVVLLIDNPPSPSSAEDRALLEETRALPQHIDALLSHPRTRMEVARDAFLTRVEQPARPDWQREWLILADLYDDASRWLGEQAQRDATADHMGAFFAQITFAEPAARYQAEADTIRNSIRRHQSLPSSHDALLVGYTQLVGRFRATITSFERKQYANLSHEPNKAMNLNSYIDLMGNSYRMAQTEGACYLTPTDDTVAEVRVPDADYLVTLDADSLVVPDYTVRLVQVLEQPENSNIAVAQTPYSSVPAAPGLLEYIVGATTDIQYITHQGFTYYNATYWVGANAVLRKAALHDIKTYEQQGPVRAAKYIQDRTVIEDTESTIDLVTQGWQLYNYPERLAYSATPPDFGALSIQRARWANGGLIIFPKVVWYWLQKPLSVQRWREVFVRSNYLISIMAVNFGTLVLMVYPFSDGVFSWLLPVASVPYYLLYGRDLVHLGYQKRDLARVYALNLLLLPVNIAGVLKSVEQGLTRKKIPFGRTPKVQGRTAVAPRYLVFHYVLLLYSAFAIAFDMLQGHLTHAVFSAFNGLLLLYALCTFIGVRESTRDMIAQLRMPRVVLFGRWR